MSGKAFQCKVCGSKELYKGAFCKPCHRDYQTNGMRASRSAKKAMAARSNPQKPLVVNSKKHRAPGQAIAPPAPKVEVKPEPVRIPPGVKVTRVELNISRWEHGGKDLWEAKT